MTWTETAHPRNAKGPGGGEFKGGNAAATTAKPAASRKRTSAAPHGSMSYNGKTGTGYGSLHGDPRVKKLQAMLNKLGLKDAHGKPLAVDGKLGPLTTQAVKRWQAKNGIKPANGVVTASMLAKAGKPAHRKAALTKRKPLKAKPKKAARPNVPPVRPKPY